MALRATTTRDLDLIAPGSRVVVRDLDWQVVEVERHSMGAKAIVRCVGRSELVRDQRAAFHSDLDVIEPEDPARTRFRLDQSRNGIETRLIIESLIRRTPLPVSNTNLTVGQAMLADDLPYQREPFRAAMAQLQPRLLVADSVGLGKTIEVGMLLAELQRRGRANRVLAVVPRHILDQVQHELWCRAGFPLVRLDTEGIRRLRQKIPAGRNPFTYFNRVIVSIDTIKHPSHYRQHLEKVRWDVVWIDESHKLVNRGTLNNQLAQVLAPNADALILTSATPHNGKAESFAELIALLDPTAVTDPENVSAAQIAHLVVRRHKHSPDVEAVIGEKWAERAEPLPISVIPTAEEEAVFAELSSTWIGPGVSPPCEHFGPGRLPGELLVDAKERSPREHHGSRRHADRVLHRPHAIRTRKRRAALHELVEVRRPDLRVAQRGDGVGALVVGEQKHDVRRPLLLTARRGERRQDES